MSTTIELGVQGMTCASCVGRVERALKKVDGVLSASINLATERASVSYLSSVSVGQLKVAVREAGYEVLEVTTRLGHFCTSSSIPKCHT